MLTPKTFAALNTELGAGVRTGRAGGRAGGDKAKRGEEKGCGSKKKPCFCGPLGAFPRMCLRLAGLGTVHRACASGTCSGRACVGAGFFCVG